MQKGQLNIHSENILPIIKKWLYSERDIFIRELVSNASDAIQKREVLAKRGESSSFEPKIEVKIDSTNKTITISDNGIGLNASEAEKYLSQIAFSGAEEFMKTYQLQDAFIGHFGLGFYSSYMVAENVEVQSRSYKPNEAPIVWRCEGGTDYTIEEGQRQEVGTDVVLHVMEEAVDFLKPATLRSLLNKFCAFFPIPVYFEGSLINPNQPLWIKKPSDCTETEYKTLYSQLFPFEEPPLFWIHLNVEYPFHVKGILYFPHTKELSQNTSGVRLYCNRVFVSNDCSDILPEYLMMLKGVIDSPDIPLNVSRSHLQVDKTVRQLSTHIVKKIADALVSLYNTDKARFETVWPDIERVIKIGSLQDEQFFSKVRDVILWRTVKKNWISSGDLKKLESCAYVDPAQVGSSLVESYTSLGNEVIVTASPIDAALMMTYEKAQEPIHFKRLDAEGHSFLLDPTREKSVLDQDGRSIGSKISDFFRKVVPSGFSVEAKSLKEDTIPLLLQFDEQKRRVRDYLRHMQPSQAEMVTVEPIVLVNTNNPAVVSLYNLYQINPEDALGLAKNMVDLQRLEQGELTHEEARPLYQGLWSLIEKQANKKT